MQLAAEMRKRTPQLGCLFALPSPDVFIRAAFEIGPAVRCCCGLLAPKNPACWAGWVLGEAARAASSCPAPADEARRGGRMLRGMRGREQDWGLHFLCQAVPGACWSRMTAAALHFALHLPGMLQSHGWLFARARSTHTSDPHPCLDLRTVLTSHCEMG